jgi:hypothetical protein
MKSQDIPPLIISIFILILVTILKNHSRLVAAIAATMPINVPLALWIFYVSTGGERKAVSQFTGGMLLGIVPTIAFIAAIWIGARFGLKLVPLLFVGYAVWGIVLAISLLFRHLVGF